MRERERKRERERERERGEPPQNTGVEGEEEGRRKLEGVMCVGDRMRMHVCACPLRCAFILCMLGCVCVCVCVSQCHKIVIVLHSLMPS